VDSLYRREDPETGRVFLDELARSTGAPVQALLQQARLRKKLARPETSPAGRVSVSREFAEWVEGEKERSFG
jgi:hypothetical protein